MILENGHGCVTVSEYCGCVAVALVPESPDPYGYDADDGIWYAWCKQIEDNWARCVFDILGETMVPLGTGSNGVTIYRRVK